MLKESDILYQRGSFWLVKENGGWNVYRDGIAHATQCAFVGESYGIERAKAEVDRRYEIACIEPMRFYPYLVPGRSYVLRIPRDKVTDPATPNKQSVLLLRVDERKDGGPTAKIRANGQEWYVRPHALYER